MAASFSTLGANTATSTGLAVTPGQDTKGTYVEFTASSAIAAKMIYVYILNSGTAEIGSFTVDIATGASSSEVVRIPDIYVELPSGSVVWTQRVFRVDESVFAAGTRIAVRSEGPTVTGTEGLTCILVLCDTALPDLTGPATVAYGITLGADIKGKVYDLGGVAHTKTGYIELTSGAEATLQYFTLILGRNGNNAMVAGTGLLDIATGAAASESVKIANLPFATDGGSDMYSPITYGPFPGDIFQSQRIAINAQGTIIDATDRIFTFAANGTTGTAVSAGGGGMRLAGHGGLAA